MIGEDASSAFLQLLKQLIDISNTIAEGHYRRHANDVKVPKKPKIKIGEISKKDFKKLNEKFDMDFRHLAVPKEKLPDIENALKELGGSYFVCKIDEGSNALIAVPAKQLDLANTAIKHVISDTLKDAPDSLKIHDGTEKLDEELMKITSDIMLDRDIPSFSFKSEDDRYINIVPDEFEGQYQTVLNEAREIQSRMNKIDFTNFYQTEQLEDIDYKVEKLFPDEAEKYFRAAKEKGIKADFVKDGADTIIKYSKQDEAMLKTAKAEVDRQSAEADNFMVDVTDNTVTMNIEKLLQAENESEYFFRVPNTAGQDYIKLNKSDTVKTDNDKTVCTKIDLKKDYPVFDMYGNFKSMRKGEELAASYNTKSRFVNKDTEVFRYGRGFQRIDLYDRNKNQLICLDLDKAENVRKTLSEHGLSGIESDILLRKIYEKMPDEYREKFNFSAEKTDIVYADIPNIGEYLAQAQLSEQIVGKADFCGERRTDSGFRCCVADMESGKYTVIGTMPKAKMISQLEEMGYEKLTAKQIADRILRDNPGFDSQDIENDEPRPKPMKFNTKNPQIDEFSYYKTNTGFMLVQDSRENYRCIDIDKGSEPSAVENIFKKNKLLDGISYAEMMKCMRDAGIINIVPNILKGRKEKDIEISRLTEEYAEIKCDGKSVILNKNNIDEKALSEIGISEKGINNIRKSFEKSEKMTGIKGKGKNLDELKKFAGKAYKNMQQTKDKIAEHIPKPKTGDAR